VTTPYYVDELVTLYCGDAREVLSDIGDVFDIVLTDPPYSSGGFQESGKSAGSIGTRTKEKIALDNLSTRGYERLMRETLRHCNQADEIYVFTDWRMWVYTFDSIEAAGWRVRNMLVWDKMQMGMGMPWRNQHELIVYGKRSPAQINDGKQGNVLQMRRSGNNNHPTEKPVPLLARLLGNSSGSVVCDPFAGSGSTLLAAREVGMKSIGIEVEPRYCDVIVERLAQGVL
jgi:DNA modification methylase